MRVMAGIQSIDQLYDVYGKEKGAVIASGFGSILHFIQTMAHPENTLRTDSVLTLLFMNIQAARKTQLQRKKEMEIRSKRGIKWN